VLQRIAIRGNQVPTPPTIRDLWQVQHDTASLATITEDPEHLEHVGPAYLRSRAGHYRDLAAQEANPGRARQFLDFAAAFEQQAVLKEKRTPS
jgi:hypothetical protein